MLLPEVACIEPGNSALETNQQENVPEQDSDTVSLHAVTEQISDVPNQRTLEARTVYLDSFGWSKSPEMIKTAKLVVKGITGYHEGTIGRFAKTPALYMNAFDE